MKYSIIVATYNRIAELRELIDSLELLEFDPSEFELLVVDDGSDDGTETFVSRIEAPFEIQYLKQSNQGPGAARNLGMENARGEYFIFVDSDVILPENYLQAIDSHVGENRPDAFGGPDDSHPSFGDFLLAVNYSMTSFIGTGGSRGSKKSVTRFYPRSFNMGLHRNVYRKIGGMGSLRHGQDMDFSARIYREGFKVDFIEEGVVYHKRRTSLGRFFKQIFNWGVARINLGRRYSEMLKPIHFFPAGIVLGVAILALFSGFVPFATEALMAAGLVALAVGLFACIQSFARYGKWSVALLSIVTLFTQVFAYGLGVLFALGQVFAGRAEAKGITKNYYK